MAQPGDPHHLVDHLFRQEAGKMVAVLTRLFGLPQVDLAQDIVQESPDPIVAFNRAIALGYANGARAGLEALLAVEGLQGNHFYHAALGDFYRKLDRREEART